MEYKSDMANSSTVGEEASDTTYDGYSFAGRIGGNQLFALKRQDNANRELLFREPDAAPGMSIKEQFDLAPLRTLGT